MIFLCIVFCFLCVSFLEASMEFLGHSYPYDLNLEQSSRFWLFEETYVGFKEKYNDFGSFTHTDTYKAGMYSESKIEQLSSMDFMVYEAAKSDIDILVLPSLNSDVIGDNYDEMIKTLATSARDSKLYIVAHLYEKSQCQNNNEKIQSSLVFDRDGSLIAIYRKPLSHISNCTISSSDLITFRTDFGVTFGLLMEEDIIIHTLEHIKGLKNFIVTGDIDGTGFNAAEFFPSWSYVNNVNLVSSKGIYGSKLDAIKTSSRTLEIATIDANAETVADLSVPVITSDLSYDLSQYSIKPLDLVASTQGYKDTVCYGSFCCEFDVKARVNGQNTEMSYSLAAFDGVRPFTNQHNIGVQSCMLYLRKNDSTHILFERISVTANYTKQSFQYPVIHSNTMLAAEKLKISTQPQGIYTLATLEISDSQHLLRFGIFGRDFSKDFQSLNTDSSANNNPSDNINENEQEWFDYVWIRLRILLVVVSLYVLEMM